MRTAVIIDYTNWRDERRARPVLPLRIMYKASAYHPVAQWVLIALDLEDFKEKEFPMQSIHNWQAPDE